MWKKSWWTCVGAGVLCAALPLMSFAQADDPQPQQRAAVRSLRLAAERLAEDQEAQVAATPASEYWIGLGLGSELADIVKEQLGLEHGLIVDDVFDDGPAAKAGFKKNDILVKVGDKSLAEPADLVKAVEEAKEMELTIGVLRGGKELSLKVTPAKRPAQEFEARIIELPKDGQPGQLQEEIKRLEEALKALKEKGGNDGAGIFFARPGVVASRNLNVIVKHEFPKDLSISVTKEGDTPAKIHIKRGDKEWEVTEDKQGELPDDIRPHVHHFFGGLWGPGLKEMAARGLVGGPKMVPPATATAPYNRVVPPPATPVPAPPTADAPRSTRTFQYRLESRGAEDKLAEILKEIQRLRKDVDDLRGKSDDEKK